MSDQYFMRVKGRVLGPYELDKLQQLARRGQLSRMHEVSKDGVTWKRASEFPELFEAPPKPEQINISDPGPTTEGGDPNEEPVNPKPPNGGGSPTALWFYTSGGMQRGPIDFSQLQLLAASGQLHPNDQVWTEGMSNWVEVRTVPGITFPGTKDKPGEPGGELSKSLCKSAAGSQAWATLVAAVIEITAILTFIGGFILVIFGARDRNPGALGSGIVWLVQAVVWVIAGILLHAYCRRLAALKFSSEAVLLENAMDALRTFWIYVGIYLIVMLVLITIVVIYAFAAGVTFPGL